MTPTDLKFVRDPTAKSIYVGLMEHFSSYPMPYWSRGINLLVFLSPCWDKHIGRREQTA